MNLNDYVPPEVGPAAADAPPMSLSDAQEIVQDKMDYWEAMHRNGLYLPAYSNFITAQYLEDVHTGKLHAPEYSEIRLRPCPRPPAKQYIISELYRLSLHKHKNLGIIPGKKEPDTQWCLNVLSTWAPNHSFFRKSYVPPTQQVKAKSKLADKLRVTNPEFFAGLPEKLGKKKKGRSIVKPMRE